MLSPKAILPLVSAQSCGPVGADLPSFSHDARKSRNARQCTLATSLLSCRFPPLEPLPPPCCAALPLDMTLALLTFRDRSPISGGRDGAATDVLYDPAPGCPPRDDDANGVEPYCEYPSDEAVVGEVAELGYAGGLYALDEDAILSCAWILQCRCRYTQVRLVGQGGGGTT